MLFVCDFFFFLTRKDFLKEISSYVQVTGNTPVILDTHGQKTGSGWTEHWVAPSILRTN